MPIISLTTYRSLTNTSNGSDDTYIQSLIDATNNQVEVYCDRSFDSQDYLEWYDLERTLILKQYPITSIKMLGELNEVASFTADYNYEVTPTALNITDANLVSTAITFSPAITNLTQIANACSSIATMTIEAGYENLNYKLLRTGTGKTIYGAKRSDYQTYLLKDEARTLEIVNDGNFTPYNYPIVRDNTILVVYTAGYTAQTMPKSLQMILCNIVKNISDANNSGINGIVTSETITNFSWSSSTELLKNVGNEIKKYYDQLDQFVRKTI